MISDDLMIGAEMYEEFVYILPNILRMYDYDFDLGIRIFQSDPFDPHSISDVG
jgi:hypothetical protein